MLFVSICLLHEMLFSGQSSVQIEHSGFVSAGKFHPVTPHLVATGATDCIQVWDIRQSAVPVRMLTHEEQLGQVRVFFSLFFL